MHIYPYPRTRSFINAMLAAALFSVTRKHRFQSLEMKTVHHQACQQHTVPPNVGVIMFTYTQDVSHSHLTRYFTESVFSHLVICLKTFSSPEIQL